MFPCICVCMCASILDGFFQTVGDIQCSFYLSTVSRAIGWRVFSIRRTPNKRIGGIRGTECPCWLVEPHCSSVSWAQGGPHYCRTSGFSPCKVHSCCIGWWFHGLASWFPLTPNTLPNRLMFISRGLRGWSSEVFNGTIFLIFLAFKDSRNPSDKSPDWLT